MIGEGLDTTVAPDMGEALAMFAEALGRTAFRSQRSAGRDPLVRSGPALAEPFRLDEIVASSLVTKGSAMTFSGYRREGMALLEGAIVDARAHGQSVMALRGGNNLASVMSEADPRSALDRIREGMALARRLGLLSFDSYHAGNASGAAERLGEWEWARVAIGDLVDVAPDRLEADWLAACRDFATAWTGDPDIERAQRLYDAAVDESDFQTQLNTSSWIARCEFAAGHPEAALERSAPFFTYAESNTGGWDLAMVGRFALHAGRLDVARRVLDWSKTQFGGVIDDDLSGLRAGITALEGRTADALALYRSALSGYREAGCRFDVALTILDMAMLIGPEEPAVRSVLPEAREILESLGATLLLDRLDALVSTEADTGLTTARHVGATPRDAGRTPVMERPE